MPRGTAFGESLTYVLPMALLHTPPAEHPGGFGLLFPTDARQRQQVLIDEILGHDGDHEFASADSSISNLTAESPGMRLYV